MKRTIDTWVSAILILLAAANAVKAQSLPDRPQIPAGKVLTPGGRLVDADCVFEVPAGGTVNKAGDVTVNGTLASRHTPCTREQMGLATAAQPQAPQAAQWMADTWAWADSGTYGQMFSWWQVPANPSMNGALFYLFPSFQSNTTDANLVEIIQPVLQWGYNGSFGGNYWVMASWYVSSTQAPHSTPMRVYAGHQLYGDTYDGGGGLWGIFMQDQNNKNVYTNLWATPRGPFDTVQGGVLEAYFVTNCSQLPSGTAGSTLFLDKIFDAGFVQVFPNWTTQIGTIMNPNPNCNYAASPQNDTVFSKSLATISY